MGESEINEIKDVQLIGYIGHSDGAKSIGTFYKTGTHTSGEPCSNIL